MTPRRALPGARRQPLIRPDILEVCERIRAIDGLQHLGITTNGLVLQRMLPGLQKAGVPLRSLSCGLEPSE
jgi:molybdenum cofactor biosynthesis enzyme MoaA